MLKFIFISCVFVAVIKADCPCPNALYTHEVQVDAKGVQAKVFNVMSNVYQSATQIFKIVGLNTVLTQQDYYKVDESDKCFLARVNRMLVKHDKESFFMDVVMKGEALESGLRNTVCSCKATKLSKDAEVSTELCQTVIRNGIKQRMNNIGCKLEGKTDADGCDKQ